MALTATEQPYEFLARWDQSGNLVGAHVQRRFVTRLDGRIIAEAIGQAEPVMPDTNSTYPLSDIMDAATAGALAQTNILAAQLDDVRAALVAMTDARDLAIAQRDALAQQLGQQNG